MLGRFGVGRAGGGPQLGPAGQASGLVPLGVVAAGRR